MKIASLPLFSDTDLVSLFQFESGALTTDSKGSNTLTNNNSVGETTGKYGGAADFGASNTNKYFSRSDSLGLLGADDLSFTGWLKLATAPASGEDQQLFHINMNSGSINLSFSYRNSGGTLQLYAQRNKNGVGSEDITHAITLALNTWVHLGFQYDGSTLKIFHQGVEVASASASGTGSNPVTNLTGIGQDGGGGSLVKGAIDDFGFVKRDLTAAEWAALAKGGGSAAALLLLI